MNVLVSDTSVLIDLERGSLLETSFALTFRFAVPDLLYRQELALHGGPALVELGLRVEELDPQGVALALGYRQAHRPLSLPDCFALALAKRNAWTLLSGDRHLRQLAANERVACHGVLWVVDRVSEQGLLSNPELHTCVQAIAAHPRCRLPRQELRERLERFSDG